MKRLVCCITRKDYDVEYVDTIPIEFASKEQLLEDIKQEKEKYYYNYAQYIAQMDERVQLLETFRQESEEYRKLDAQKNDFLENMYNEYKLFSLKATSDDLFYERFSENAAEQMRIDDEMWVLIKHIPLPIKPDPIFILKKLVIDLSHDFSLHDIQILEMFEWFDVNK